MTIFYCYHASPLGNIRLTASELGVQTLYLPTQKNLASLPDEATKDAPRFKPVCEQLDAYFSGELRQFDVNLDPVGTKFQKQVWAELVKIPYGKTATYGELAAMINNPSASRAVGAANGKNPVAIIIPCHRVIGKSGALTGYAGGLAAKEHLLNLERGDSELASSQLALAIDS